MPQRHESRRDQHRHQGHEPSDRIVEEWNDLRLHEPMEEIQDDRDDHEHGGQPRQAPGSLIEQLERKRDPPDFRGCAVRGHA